MMPPATIRGRESTESFALRGFGSPPPNASSLREQPSVGLLLSFALLVFVVAGGAVAAYGAMRIDQEHRDVQRASLVAAIEDYRTGLAESVAALASRWAAARAASASSIDLGSVAMSWRHRYRHVFLFDGKGRLVATDPPAATVPAPVVRLIAGQWERRAHRDAIVTPLVPATSLVLLEDGPAFTAITAVADATEGDAEIGALVAVAPLDAHLLDRFEKASGVGDLRFATEPGDGELLAQHDTQGRLLGWFGWTARLPFAGALARHGPALAMLAAVIALFAALTVAHFRQRFHRLSAGRQQALRLADCDPLTGLPNRSKLLEMLDHAVRVRASDEVVSLSVVNLDGFKEINEGLGHGAGDRLLAAVAARLSGAVPPAATVGRIGSDEFAIVMTAGDDKVAIETGATLARAMEDPFFVADQAVTVSASIGVSHAPRDGSTRDDLIRRADLAARSAKRRGRGRVVGFDHGLEEQLRERRFIRNELQRALAARSLDVHYQPIVAADGLRIVGAEALLRWTHPTRGPISPAVFIPIAEEAGLMGQLGEFVLRRALADARGWSDLFICVNISPVQMRDRAFLDLVSSAIVEAGIAAGRVVLEITEGVLIENPEEARQRLKELRELGVKIALDDFGSGYSSLSYLRRLPIDKLKIDREFVKPLGHSADGGVILQAMIGLGRALGLSVLAEGVETEEQRVLLRLAGCDEMQGFLFGRPAARTVLDRLVATGKLVAPAPSEPKPVRQSETAVRA